MFGNLDNKEIEVLLKRQVVGRIGCHAKGLTYIVPVSYAYDGHYIYVYTLEGMKVDIMRNNPKVCFEVDDISCLMNWQSVIVWGEFEELTDDKSRRKALKKLNERILPVISSETMHLSPLWPFEIEERENMPGVVFRIRLTKKTGRFEKSSDQFFYAT
jgi:uncharacterized protein